jgi:hypothetical protein
MGIYEEVKLDNDMTVETIAKRVVDNRERFQAKFDKKKIQQDTYYDTQKEFHAEL